MAGFAWKKKKLESHRKGHRARCVWDEKCRQVRCDWFIKKNQGVG